MSKKKREAEESADQPGFEHALEQLQQIVRELESGQLTLEDSLAKYEQGVRHLRQCHETLQKAEQRIRMLVDLDDTGRAITKPFKHQASVEEDDASDDDVDDEYDSDSASENGDKPSSDTPAVPRKKGKRLF